MGSGESKGAGSPMDGETEEFDRQVAADAAAEHAAEERQAAEAAAKSADVAAETTRDGANGAKVAHTSGNLMPATPRGELGMAPGADSHIGSAPTPPGTADRMIAEVTGDSTQWNLEPPRSFGTEVEPNTLAPAAEEESKPSSAEEVKTTQSAGSIAESSTPATSVGEIVAAERDAAADAIVDAGIHADEQALLEDEEALMNQIVGEYGTNAGGAFGTVSTGFDATGSTAASAVSSEAEDLLSLTELRKEVGVAHQMMSTGEIIEGLMDETTTGAADVDGDEIETPKRGTVNAIA